MDAENRELSKVLIKKLIDDHSCKEPLEVGFRRGVEWFVFESGVSFIGDFLKKYDSLLKENKELKESLARQVQP